MVQPTGSQTNIQYQAPTWTIVYQDQNTPGDRAHQSQSVYDGFGRILEQRTLEGGSTGTLIAVDTAYDALGRAMWTSNPSRITISSWSGDGLAYQTFYTYDSLGRITSLKAPDGGTTTTSYTGDQTTVTDAAGHMKRYTYDGLGQLWNVKEDPNSLNYTSDYRYCGFDTRSTARPQ